MNTAMRNQFQFRSKQLTGERGGSQFALALLSLLASTRMSDSVRAEADAASEGVLATFNTGRITQAELEQAIAQRLPEERARIAAEGGRETMLESLIDYDLLVQEARGRGYERNVAVVEAARSKASELMIAQRLPLDPSSVGEAELEQARAEYRREFGRPRMRRASQIVCATKAEAAALIATTKHASRERFAQLARERSTDPAGRSQGGELGYFDEHGTSEQGREVAPPQLTAAAFKLEKVGDIAPLPIAVTGGYSVLMLTGELKPFVTPQPEVEEQLRERIAARRRSVALDALVAELKSQLQPVVHAELSDAVVMPAEQPRGIPAGFPAAPPDPREPPKLQKPDKF